MGWIDLILLVIVILIINDNQSAIKRDFNEKETRDNLRLLDIEARISKIEGKSKIEA